MKHYLFEEFYTGIQFLVNADYLGVALKAADAVEWDYTMFELMYDDEPKILYLGQVSDEEAEMCEPIDAYE